LTLKSVSLPQAGYWPALLRLQDREFDVPLTLFFDDLLCLVFFRETVSCYGPPLFLPQGPRPLHSPFHPLLHRVPFFYPLLAHYVPFSIHFVPYLGPCCLITPPVALSCSHLCPVHVSLSQAFPPGSPPPCSCLLPLPPAL